nr:DUF4157 domain-containing protein [Pedobacter sp. ASV2]
MMKPSKKASENNLSANLKKGIEELSGVSMDNVRVHYNSDKPEKLSADTFAQGTNIHVGPNQENHLPHEAWHVVQQKQGRVKPTGTVQSSNTEVNERDDLEKIADEMGKKAVKKSRE